MTQNGYKQNQAVAPVEQAQEAAPLEANRASDQPAAAPTVVRTVASPLRLQATPPVLRRAPPALGEHTDEVLAELGLDAPQIAGLRSRNVV